MTTRPCPYCAEEIQAEAILCRHCHTRLVGIDPGQWQRNQPERKLAGVAAAVSHALGIPIGIVRLGFLATAFVHMIGVILYVGLWLVIPATAGQPSVLDWTLDRVQGMFRDWFGTTPPSGPGHSTVVPGGPDA